MKYLFIISLFLISLVTSSQDTARIFVTYKGQYILFNGKQIGNGGWEYKKEVLVDVWLEDCKIKVLRVNSEDWPTGFKTIGSFFRHFENIRVKPPIDKGVGIIHRRLIGPDIYERRFKDGQSFRFRVYREEKKEYRRKYKSI